MACAMQPSKEDQKEVSTSCFQMREGCGNANWRLGRYTVG